MQVEASLTTVQRALFLMELELFGELSSDELATLAAEMVEMRFDAGETIFQEGDAEARMHIIIEGAVEHVLDGVVVRRATRRMPFGLFRVMGIPDSETIRATEPTRAIALSREDFIEAISENPALAVGFIRALAKVIQSFAHRIEALEKKVAPLEERKER
jgi:CRP/FNR family cyclic AMP-dependent transcriptional regulator